MVPIYGNMYRLTRELLGQAKAIDTTT
jgi:hypothetical protein